MKGNDSHRPNRLRSAALACLLVVVMPTIAGAQIRDRGCEGTRVEEGYFASINGVEQWITIRGDSRCNPVLMVLHGGPGMAASSGAPLYAIWEKDYTVVQWDQPMSGATYAKNVGKDIGPLTIERYVADAGAVIDHVRDRLDKSQVIIMGASWGSILGIHLAHDRPEDIAAYVGTPQVVSGPRGMALNYELALEAARKNGNTEAINALEALGPPPFSEVNEFMLLAQYSNAPVIPPSPEEMAALYRIGPLLLQPPSPDATHIPRDVALPDMTQTMQVLSEAVGAVYSEMRIVELRNLGLDFDVPIFVFQGERDLVAPASLAREYVEGIQAPAKGFEVIRGAGHATAFFSEDLLALLNTHVRPHVKDDVIR
jgi:pimeloyl-ACP methyl ester carboxylesterase